MVNCLCVVAQAETIGCMNLQYCRQQACGELPVLFAQAETTECMNLQYCRQQACGELPMSCLHRLKP